MTSFKDLAIRFVVLGVGIALCAQAQDQAPAPAVEEGLASWYGPSFDGQRAASGEIFDSGQFTAAHRTLPFGTKVRVRRQGSQDSIVVRINDRGPFIDSRIIDLSYAAARQLGVTTPGIFKVVLEVVGLAEASIAGQSSFAVRVGTFRNVDNARRVRDLVQSRLAGVSMERLGEFWCVLVGNAASQAQAEATAVTVRGLGAAFRSAYVVRSTQ